jgi:hypothetical protein
MLAFCCFSNAWLRSLYNWYEIYNTIYLWSPIRKRIELDVRWNSPFNTPSSWSQRILSASNQSGQHIIQKRNKRPSNTRHAAVGPQATSRPVSFAIGKRLTPQRRGNMQCNRVRKARILQCLCLLVFLDPVSDGWRPQLTKLVWRAGNRRKVDRSLKSRSREQTHCKRQRLKVTKQLDADRYVAEVNEMRLIR